MDVEAFAGFGEGLDDRGEVGEGWGDGEDIGGHFG